MGRPIAHNQTQRQHIKNAVEKKERSLAPEIGVAIFVVPDPEKGVDALKGVAVDGIDYEESVRRAEHCLMFKWVPHSVGTLEDYQAAKASPSFHCTGRCYSESDCPHSWCFCGGLGPIYECELY
ncbi:hypothetical protein [Bacillus inaquosorum]|uniref:hypothetical protein n=1 Tax=Bacillus inaquosorum TaxID=483913 RepID=UPI00227F811C|nr:hypothetical protein [Bacillus inaquosorum]MCY9398078.1 hypothetical protein [Bacillus inaquosorum]